MIVFLFLLFAQPTLMPGWPVSLPAETQDYWNAPGAKAFDFDGDGQKEIVVATGNANISLLAVFRVDGTFYPGWPQTIGPPPLYASTPVAIGDIDGDGEAEIVVGSWNPYSGEGGRLYAFEPDGSLEPGFPLDLNCTIPYPPTLADLEGDGKPEILFGCYFWGVGRPESGSVYVVEGNGGILEGWPREVKIVHSRIHGVDLTGDGVKEVVALVSERTTEGQDVPWVRVWDLEGNPVQGWPRYYPGESYSFKSPTFAEIDSNPGLEMFVPAEIFSTLTGVLHLYRGNGEELPEWPEILPATYFASPAAIADWDRDGHMEFFLTGAVGGV